MKFLWQSNAPWAGTGYGQQTRLILKALLDLGNEPCCFAFYGLSGGKIDYDGYPVLPNSDYESWGNDVVKAHIEQSNSDVLITLMDLFVLKAEIYGKLPVPWVAWTPLDSEGIGPDTRKMLELSNMPIAMSMFGVEQMRRYDIEPGAMIYHACDTEVFQPRDKAECREIYGLDQDAFLVGMVMANKGDRKQYPQQLYAIKQWQDENPDLKIRVFLHTDPTASMGGWDMPQLVKEMGLKGKVSSTNQYLTSVVPSSAEMMSQLYNCFDVLMNCSAGEGFGIPIIEAQACGVPVITQGVTAMTELTQNGYTVESANKSYSAHYGWQFGPSLDDMIYRLDCVYRNSNSLDSLRGREWVIENCSLPVIGQQWADLLKFLEESMLEERNAARIEFK